MPIVGLRRGLECVMVESRLSPTFMRVFYNFLWSAPEIWSRRIVADWVIGLARFACWLGPSATRVVDLIGNALPIADSRVHRTFAAPGS